MSRSLVVVLGTLALFACARTTSKAQVPAERPPATLKVSSRSGVTLEVLDWGGSGPPIVFLAGGGSSTPHDFDDFAPRFTDRHRVIGITRRGNGGSSAVRPRTFDDYVDDIVAVLDAFHFEKPVLIGHSFAGLEMARFGEKHGRRCAALVYLDAAYDYSDPALFKIFETNSPPSAPMGSADSASIDAVLAWSARTQGFQPPVSALRASRLWGKDGRLIGQVPSPADSWNIPDPTPHWGAVSCPSLGIYAMPTPYETSLHFWSLLDSLQQARAKAYYAVFAPWTKKNRDAFGRFPQNHVVEFPSMSHMFFMAKPDETERVISAFLNNLHASPPDGPRPSPTIADFLAPWAMVFRDSAFQIALDTSRVERIDADSYLVWMQTRWRVPRRGSTKRTPSPFNRELIHTFLRCQPVAYRVAQTVVSLNGGPAIDSIGSGVDSARQADWHPASAGSADAAAGAEACRVLNRRSRRPG